MLKSPWWLATVKHLQSPDGGRKGEDLLEKQEVFLSSCITKGAGSK